MPKFRKKPVVIEALQFDGTREGGLTIRERWPDVSFGVTDGPSSCIWDGTLKIHTLEGVMTATSGDWIIQGVKGELYPCKAEIFNATYEEVKDAE